MLATSVCSALGYEALPAAVRAQLGGLEWRDHLESVVAWELAHPGGGLRLLDSARIASEIVAEMLAGGGAGGGEEELAAWEVVHLRAQRLLPAGRWPGGARGLAGASARLRAGLEVVSELGALHEELHAALGEEYSVLVADGEELLAALAATSPIPQQVTVRVEVRGDPYGATRTVSPGETQGVLVALLVLGIVYEGVVITGADEPDGWQMRSWRIGARGLSGQSGEVLGMITEAHGVLRSCHTPPDILRAG